MKTVSIFGSTGSIGTQTLDVLREFREDFAVVGLVARESGELLMKQAAEFEAVPRLGLEQVDDLIHASDLVVNAVPGFEGLGVSEKVLRAGKVLLSANKESLAVGGRFLKQIAREFGGEIRPLDSEASALWQLLGDTAPEQVSSVTLTCSGGPFRGRRDLSGVTVEEALKHPTWKMGPKVSLDSATLVNKVLEVYEVHELFEIPLEKIFIRIHPQSWVHAMLHTQTGGTKMHLSKNDMKLFIATGLFWPKPVEGQTERFKRSELIFEEADETVFRPLAWLRLHRNNPMFPVALNALNDCTSRDFLAGRIEFLEIYERIEAGLERWLFKRPPASLEELRAVHQAILTDYEHLHSARGGRVPASQDR